MKITDVRSFVVYGGLQNWVFVELLTDEGVTGLGEASISWLERSVDEAVHWVARYIVGQDPLDVERLWQTMYRETYYRGGAIPQAAISGIDMALWDIAGKARDAPAHKLLGGLCHDRLRLYGQRLVRRRRDTGGVRARRRRDGRARLHRPQVRPVRQ